MEAENKPEPGGEEADPLVREWWDPFAAHLALERRYSAYTLRNYRQAFADVVAWRRRALGEGAAGRELSGCGRGSHTEITVVRRCCARSGGVEPRARRQIAGHST